jgi:hypothetical protein
MTRSRRPDDWNRDLAAARQSERALATSLSLSERIHHLEDHTAAFDRLDFSFVFESRRVYVDIKEKRQSYSRGVTELWPDTDPLDLFILDETVYRRIIWQGGGGYLVVHDHPGSRWALFGPWELTLGPRVRYQRWGERGGRFVKGKLLINLSAAAVVSKQFLVDDLLRVVAESRANLDAVESVATRRQTLRELGR